MAVEHVPETTCIANQSFQLWRDVSEKCQRVVVPVLEAPGVRPDGLMTRNAIAERIERNDELAKSLYIVLWASPGSVGKPLPDGLAQFRVAILSSAAERSDPYRHIDDVASALWCGGNVVSGTCLKISSVRSVRPIEVVLPVLRMRG